MTWIEKIEAAKLRRNDTAGECMAMIQALAAERDELQAQVAVLRKGMEFIADTTSHKRAVQLAIRFVATTPAEAAERVRKLVEEMESTADDIGIEINNLQDVHNGIVQSAVHHLRDVASGIDKALSEWRRDKCSS